MNAIIGKKLKVLRIINGFSQTDASSYFNMSQASYSRLERGQSHYWVYIIDAICELYKIRKDDFLKVDFFDFKPIH